MVLDKGLGLETAESLMNISGEYVDYLKFGWGTSIVHEQDIIKAKVRMYLDHDITPYTGGTLFELAYMNDKLDEFFVILSTAVISFDKFNYLLDLKLADKRALNTHRLGRADGSKEHITASYELFRSCYVDDGS